MYLRLDRAALEDLDLGLDGPGRVGPLAGVGVEERLRGAGLEEQLGRALVDRSLEEGRGEPSTSRAATATVHFRRCRTRR